MAGRYLKDHEYVRDKDIYVIEASIPYEAPESIVHIPFTERISFANENDIVRDILLLRNYEDVICGKVCDTVGNPISGAHVEGQRGVHWQRQETVTGDDGIYCLDQHWYEVIIATAPGHAPQERFPEDDGAINFYLELPGLISGHVRDIHGAGLGSVPVEIVSESSDYMRNTLTDEDGHYLVDDLPADDHYTVIAYADHEEPRSESRRRTGDEVNFVFGQLPDGMSGIVTDLEGHRPPEGVRVIGTVFEEAGDECVMKTEANISGEFDLTDLSPDVGYHLRLTAYGSDMPVSAQWHAEPHGFKDRADAETCLPGTVVTFRLDGLWDGK